VIRVGSTLWFYQWSSYPWDSFTGPREAAGS